MCDYFWEVGYDEFKAIQITLSLHIVTTENNWVEQWQVYFYFVKFINFVYKLIG